MGCFSTKAAAAANAPATTLAQEAAPPAGRGAKGVERGGPVHDVADQVTTEIERRKEDAVAAIDAHAEAAKGQVDSAAEAADGMVDAAGDKAKGAIEGAKDALEKAIVGAVDAAEDGAEAVRGVFEVEDGASKSLCCGCGR
mmetsp:Transcript_40818/g.118246  ORF Transcript_40818/g.118246 Transcript_40818/m.118246 type:complete len:141 (-) Transcript_40818:183-605(-)